MLHTVRCLNHFEPLVEPDRIEDGLEEPGSATDPKASRQNLPSWRVMNGVVEKLG
jgi:hypothetical protein